MKCKFIIHSCFLVLLTLQAYAQPADGNTKDALIISGDEQIAKGQYYRALEQYERAYKDAKEKDIAIRVAFAHLLLRDYGKAVNWYNRVLARDRSNTYGEHRFNFGRALKMNGSYTEAAEEFKKFIEETQNDTLRAWAENELKGIELRAGMKENVALDVKNAGNGINTPESQNSPAIDKTGTLYFSSLEGRTSKKDKDSDKGESDFSKLYSSTYADGSGWAKATELPELINRVGFHTANVSFSKDGNTMFFTRTVSDGGHMEESKIYASTRTATDWSPPIEVKGVNGEYMARHPVEGELFGSRVLLFSANIPGGKGGYDLYYANKIAEAEYSSPVSLGALNTPGDELCPFMEEGTLYFSSDYYPGIGGFDIFKSKWNGIEWSSPENMGIPVNSSADDLFYKVNPEGDRAVLISNRSDPQSKSLKSKTCCDDIYFIDKRKLVIDLTTVVIDEKKKGIKGATAQLMEIIGGKDGNFKSKTNTEGNEISHSLDKDKSYKVVVSKEGYFPAEIQLNTVGITSDQSILKEVILRVLPPESDVEIVTINEAIRLNNIYYDFDDDKILPDAEKDLKVLKGLMDQYGDMVIELSSHTDSRGDDTYNEKLSQRRANSAKKWLMGKGIAAARIVAKGYGEEQILNQCTNGEDCTEDEHRFNRRTEFKILAGPTTIEVKKEVLNRKGKASKK
jgi:peptidoglycan-associated lipoprotein